MFHCRGELARLSALGAWLCILSAGLFKLFDLPAFREALASWRTMPDGWVPWISTLVPTAEVFLAGAGLAGVHRRGAGAATLVLLALLTVVYIHEWTHRGESPACGCWGAWADPASPGQWVVARNMVLAGAIGAGLWAWRSPVVVPPVGPRGRRAVSKPVPTASGFTLVETLLVVLLVGLLVTLSMPALGRVRETARVTATLSNLRSHAAIFHAYAGDHREYFPYLTSPTATWSVIRSHSSGVAIRTRYFGAYMYWDVGLADAYYEGRRAHPSLRSPLRPAGSTGVNDYEMSCSFLADPAYYAPETRTYPPEQWRATRLGEVLYPHRKTLLADEAASIAARVHIPDATHLARFPLALVDGSAAHVSWNREGPQMRSGDGGPVTLHYGHISASLAPFRHALHGVRGMDAIR